MIGTEPIGGTPFERVTAYLDHIDELDAAAQDRGSGVQYGDSVHSFETLDGAYVISRSDLRMILNRLEWTEAELEYLEPGA